MRSSYRAWLPSTLCGICLFALAGEIWVALNDLNFALILIWAMATTGLWTWSSGILRLFLGVPGYFERPLEHVLLLVVCGVVCIFVIYAVMNGCYLHRGICS